MPAEKFGADYPFLDRKELLSFEEITTVAKAAAGLGVTKIRLTGGEPLLRKNIDELVRMLSAIPGIEDIALTSNGILLGHYAERLKNAGLSRVTVSLDAINPETFAAMNGVGADVDRVLSGIFAAQQAGLPVKVNAVIQKSMNSAEILPLAAFARQHHLLLRFIEFMDVGESNQWSVEEVFPADQILELLDAEYGVNPDPRQVAAVAENFSYSDGGGKVGIIRSVTQPFCSDCSRLRLSAEGKIYGCLFASTGTDLKSVLRESGSVTEVSAMLRGFWGNRTDRYSELRGIVSQKKIEMSYIGG